MIRLRRSAERGHADHGWLDTRHTFSFAGYYDPRYMGYRTLRVINDDRVAGGGGFPTHPHRDMEIVSYVVDGALEHRDSLGTGSVIRPGDVQRMTAGTGVKHSEFNPSPDDPMRLIQIWIVPEREGLAPSYEQKQFPLAERTGRLRLVASGDGRDGSLTIQQDADLYATILEPGQEVEHSIRPGRGAWIQVIRGRVDLGGKTLEEGDGAAVENESAIKLSGVEPAEVLVFDLL
jgi:quercetin 2,3-dioxygenase